MKFALMLLLVSLSVALSVGAAAKKARYPQIEAVSGTAVQVQESITVSKRQAESREHEKSMKPKMVLKDKAILRTSEKSELRLILQEQNILSLAENTEIEIPSIDWQEGRVSEIHLRRGSVRWVCSQGCDQKLITPLFEGGGVAGDFILKYDPSVPLVELSVLQGEMSFQGLQNESPVALMAGQRASFKGVMENGEPAYDILLKGRKVAKGKMGEVQEIPSAEVTEFLKQEEKKKKVIKLKPKSKRLASQICDRPWGELNQCVWTCENNKSKAKECLMNEGAVCVRQRCNANGQWSDRIELPMQNSPCKAGSFVGTCDY